MSRQPGVKLPTTITELRDDLLRLYYEIGEGMIQLPMAKEQSNAAGKIIKSAAVQLEYASVCKVKPNIPFLK